MNPGTKTLFGWIGDNLLGGAIVETAKVALTKATGETIQKVGENMTNKLTRKDLILGVVFARLAVGTTLRSKAKRAKAIAVLNGVYASLKTREERDRFEKLIFRDVLDAIQEYFKASQKKVEEEEKDPKTNKVTKTTFTPLGNHKEMYDQYLAALGEAGPQEILLELEKLEQMSGVKQVTNAIGKGANNFLGTLTSAINGLNGVKE